MARIHDTITIKESKQPTLGGLLGTAHLFLDKDELPPSLFGEEGDKRNEAFLNNDVLPQARANYQARHSAAKLLGEKL